MLSDTWRCHVCGDERPDAAISVVKRPWLNVSSRAFVNLRYCNDQSDCRQQARWWKGNGTLLREVPTRWWQFTERILKRRWERKNGRCRHPDPIYGDERGAYGLRCARCFARLDIKPWP